jgi:6-pyruvoyltetrahydropterin/6-carboxytetrahydropterin synthase
MFEVSVEHTFAAGHALRNYKGKCENVHGHNYRIQVTLRGPQLDATGMLADFVELKRVLRAISEPLDHVFINDLPPFDTLNPTAENMARYFAEKMAEELKVTVPVEVAEVKVWETDIQSATWRPPSTLSNK